MRMAPCLGAVAATGLFAGNAVAQPADKSETTVAQHVRTEFNYSSWSGTRGSDLHAQTRGRGQQLYTSAAGEVAVEKAGTYRFETDIRAGHVLSQHSAGGINTNYAGLLDTQLAMTLTLLQSASYRPFIGLALNLPTGRSVLPPQKRLTRMDADLVAVGSYGEGTNINPNVGVTFAPFQNFTIAPSIGYAIRGKFQQEASNGLFLSSALRVLAPQERSEMSPGNMLTVSTTATYSMQGWNGTAVLSYFDQSAVEVDGIAVAKQGARYAVNLNSTFELGPQALVALSGSWSFAEKNAYGADGALVKEGLNSNSHLFTGSVRPTYKFSSFSVGPQYAFLYRDQNFYSIIDAQFVPAKTKHSAGIFLENSASPDTTLSLDITRFWVHESAGSTATDANLNAIPLSYTGYNAILSAQFKF